MFFVYILSSRKRKYIYVGLTSNLNERIKRHNAGHEKTTSPYSPFEIILTEKYFTRPEARKREKQLKSGYGKEWLKTEFGL